MDARGMGLTIGALFVAAAVEAQSPAGAVDLKKSLDLPYNVGLAERDEEEAPEVLVLHGGVFEANGFVFVSGATT